MDEIRFHPGKKSQMEVATGSISITSPREEKVYTTTQKALGKVTNHFDKKENVTHELAIKAALGSISHKKI